MLFIGHITILLCVHACVRACVCVCVCAASVCVCVAYVQRIDWFSRSAESEGERGRREKEGEQRSREKVNIYITSVYQYNIPKKCIVY